MCLTFQSSVNLLLLHLLFMSLFDFSEQCKSFAPSPSLYVSVHVDLSVYPIRIY